MNAGQRPEPPLLNIANVLTGSRIVLVPVMAAMLFASHGTSTPWRVAACLAFVVASITDLYDGRLARSRQLVTRFGEVADPIADKALTGTALIGLSWLDLLPWWVTVAILVRELGVTALRFWVIRLGVIPASRGGKLKTVLQVVAISWYLLPLPGPLDLLGPPLMGVALLVTWVTAADYVLQALRLRRDARRQAAGTTSRGHGSLDQPATPANAMPLSPPTNPVPPA